MSHRLLLLPVVGALLPALLANLEWREDRLRAAIDSGMYATDVAVEAAVAGDEIDLDSGVAAAVHDLPSADRPHGLRAGRCLGGRRSGGERRADGDGAARWGGGSGEDGLGGREEEVRVGHGVGGGG